MSDNEKLWEVKTHKTATQPQKQQQHNYLNHNRQQKGVSYNFLCIKQTQVIRISNATHKKFVKSQKKYFHPFVTIWMKKHTKKKNIQNKMGGNFMFSTHIQHYLFLNWYCLVTHYSFFNDLCSMSNHLT